MLPHVPMQRDRECSTCLCLSFSQPCLDGSGLLRTYGMHERSAMQKHPLRVARADMDPDPKMVRHVRVIADRQLRPSPVGLLLADLCESAVEATARLAGFQIFQAEASVADVLGEAHRASRSEEHTSELQSHSF